MLICDATTQFAQARQARLEREARAATLATDRAMTASNTTAGQPPAVPQLDPAAFPQPSSVEASSSVTVATLPGSYSGRLSASGAMPQTADSRDDVSAARADAEAAIAAMTPAQVQKFRNGGARNV